MAKQKKAKAVREKIPIKWVVPENVASRFASHIVVQQTEDYFKLSFFEIKPQINFAADAEPEAEVRADCVASIIVTPAKFRAMVKVMDRQLEAFEGKMTKALKEMEGAIPNEPEQPS